MGSVRGGPPTELVLLLQQHFNIRHFIEMGTYTGRTAEWASRNFEKVTTAEFSKPIYEDTVKKLGYITNIDFVFGDSREVLNRLVPELNEISIFWLDSHVTSGESYGKDDECPLIDELKTFAQALQPHVLLIDDARLFLSSPPVSHNADSWPTIREVIEALVTINDDYYIFVFEDVIAAVPNGARKVASQYLQQKNTLLWNENLPGKRTGRFAEGWRMILEGTQLIAGAGTTFIRKQLAR